MLRTISIICLSILIFSCDDPSTSSHDPISLTMNFSNEDPVSGISRTSIGDQYIGNFSIFNDAYSGLGNQVDFSGSLYLSPSSFILPFTGAYLSDGVSEINLAVNLLNYPEEEWQDLANVDFCQQTSFDISSNISDNPEDGNYIEADTFTFNTIYLGIASQKRDLGYNDSVIWETPMLIVTVPGYTDTEWPNITFNEIGIYGDVYNESYIREYLGNNEFMIDLSVVLPQIEDSNEMEAYPIENYMFCSDYSEPGIVLPELEGYPDSISTNDYGHVISGSYTNTSLLLLPFEKFVFPRDANITFYIETEEILTVYDNNTPSIKSDDKLLLISDYYNRFGITLE